MPKRKRKNRQHPASTGFKNLQNHLGYLEPLKAEQVEQIHPKQHENPARCRD